MGALSNTSTLLSTYSSTNKDRQNYFRNAGSSGNGRYIVGSVGKACGKHLKRTAPRHPNVAIATQVLNPSAIGGSLKNRRFVEHFGPSEADDEVGFLSHKRRSRCGKVCCYGFSIAVTLVMMTGLVLAVGYLQSEKQKITSRPVKLAQGQILEQDNVFVSTSTTQPPATMPVPATGQPPKFLLDNDDDMDEIGLGDYADDENMLNLDRSDSEAEDTTTKKPNFEDNETKSDSGSREGEDFESDDFDSNASKTSTDIESYESQNDEHDDLYSSAVKVLPPADFKFEGVSFEFPIYRSKNSTKSLTKLMNYASAEEEETKKLETSINDVNSNFTSFSDSAEDNTAVLSPSFTNEGNYANAQSNPNPDKANNQPDSLSLPSHSHTDVISENEVNSFSKGPKSSFTHLRVSNEQSENDNKNNKDFDFDISSSTAKLQTDIFDDNEDDDNDGDDFETSASDQTKKANENIESTKRPVPRPKQQNNRYSPKNHDTIRRGPKPSSYDNEDYEAETEKPPRKLVLKTKASRKPNLSKGMESGFEKSPEPTHPTNEPPSPPISHTLPILEYKADFSNIQIPKDSMDPIKLDFKFPPPANNGNIANLISDFKFDFTTPSPPAATTESKFNLQEFLMNLKAEQTKNEFNLANFSPTPVSTNDFNIPQVQKFTPNHVGVDTSASLTSQQQQDNQFSKRTFYNNDFDPSTSGTVNSFANTNSNPFAHLLGPQPQTGSIGSASSTGATLNFFQPQQGPYSQTFNFDTTSNNPAGSYGLPSGTVPVDLSASHISVNGASYGSSGSSYSVTDPNGAYSVTSLNSDLPYPNIGLNSASNSNPVTNQGNAFSFSNYGQSGGYGSGNKNGVEVLTTGQGQVPTYNTITQGIHLLSLLSGNTPQNQNPFLNNDQYSSASSFQPQQYEISTKPQLQIAGLTGYGGSSNDFLQGLESKWRTPANTEHNSATLGNGFQTYTPSQFENNYAQDINPRKSYRSFESSSSSSSDQEPSASFSKSIVLKLSSPDFARNLKSTATEPSQQVVVPASPGTKTSGFRSLLTSQSLRKTAEPTTNEPRSLSVQILPNAVGSAATSLFDKFIRPSSKPSNEDSVQDSSISKSRKRDHPGRSLDNYDNSSSDLDAAGSELHIVTTNRPDSRYLSESQAQKLNKPEEGPSKGKKIDGGLKSGFYA